MPTDEPGGLSRLTAALARREISATEAVTEQVRRRQPVDRETNCVAAWNDDARAGRGSARSEVPLRTAVALESH